eukprot:7485385-Pyramimonas_sp.AAC.1
MRTYRRRVTIRCPWFGHGFGREAKRCLTHSSDPTRASQDLARFGTYIISRGHSGQFRRQATEGLSLELRMRLLSLHARVDTE